MGSKLLPYNPYHKLLVSESSKTVPHNKSAPTKRCGGSQHQLRNIMVNDCESGCFENGRGVQKQKPRISGVVAARVLCSLCSPCCPPECFVTSPTAVSVRPCVCVCAPATLLSPSNTHARSAAVSPSIRAQPQDRRQTVGSSLSIIVLLKIEVGYIYE